MRITVQFCITSQCNLRCTYCYQKNKHVGVMSEETAFKIVDSIFPLDLDRYEGFISKEDLEQDPIDIVDFYFFGGECTLYPELMEKIVDRGFEKIKEHQIVVDFQVSVNTNGTLMTPALRHFYAKYRHIITPNITVDGCKEVHDMCRLDANGNGSWNKVIQNLDTYFTFFPHARHTKLTISKENVKYLFEGYKNLEKLGFRTMKAFPGSGLEWTQEAVDEYKHQLDLIFDYIKSKPDDYKLIYQPFELASNSIYNAPHHKATCGLLGYDRQFCFDIDGNFFNCLRYAEHNTLNPKYKILSLGNIYNKDKIITEEGANIVCQLKEFEFKYPKKCDNCESKYMGACEFCPACSYEETGSFDTIINDNFECEMNRYLYAKSLQYMYWKTKLEEEKNGN